MVFLKPIFLQNSQMSEKSEKKRKRNDDLKSQIKQLVDNVNSKSDLREISLIIQIKLKKLNDESKIRNIIKSVDWNGFFCTATIDEDIPGLEKFRLKYHFKVETYDKENYSNLLYHDYTYELSDFDPWVVALNETESNFESDVKRKLWKIRKDQDWDYDDWDDPAVGVAYVKVSVYFKKRSIPPDKSFCCIDSNGNVFHYFVSPDKVISNSTNESISWDEIKHMLIVPDSTK